VTLWFVEERSFFVQEKSQKTPGKVFSQKILKKVPKLFGIKVPKKSQKNPKKKVKYFVSLIKSQKKSQKNPRKIPGKILEETKGRTIDGHFYHFFSCVVAQTVDWLSI